MQVRYISRLHGQTFNHRTWQWHITRTRQQTIFSLLNVFIASINQHYNPACHAHAWRKGGTRHHAWTSHLSATWEGTSGNPPSVELPSANSTGQATLAIVGARWIGCSAQVVPGHSTMGLHPKSTPSLSRCLQRSISGVSFATAVVKKSQAEEGWKFCQAHGREKQEINMNVQYIAHGVWFVKYPTSSHGKSTSFESVPSTGFFVPRAPKETRSHNLES